MLTNVILSVLVSTQISEILSIPCELRSEAQKQTLNFSPEIVSKWEKNRKKRESAKARIQEVGDMVGHDVGRC